MSRGYKTELGHATCVSNECGRRPQQHLFRFMLLVQVPATKAAGSLRLIGHQGGSDKITCDSNLLSWHRFSKLVCMED